MTEQGDLTEQELLQIDAMIAVVQQKESDGPARVIVDTVERLVREVRRWRADAKAREVTP